jgi:hypothetical protein
MKKAKCLIINVVIAFLIVSCNTRIEEQDILGTWESLDYHFAFEFLPDSLCIIHNVPDTMLWLFPNEFEVPDLNHRTTVNAQWYIGKNVNGYDGIIVKYIREYQEYGPRGWFLQLDKDLFNRKSHDILYYTISVWGDPDDYTKYKFRKINYNCAR